MAKPRKSGGADEFAERRRIKKLAIIAIFSDDELMDRFVLKGGNAIDIAHGLGVRASVDVDFSLATDLEADRDGWFGRIRKSLEQTFSEAGYRVFDFEIADQPRDLSPDLAAFWGGYRVEFKLTTASRFVQYAADLERLRKTAVDLGQGTRFVIDISRHEYTVGNEQLELDDLRIHVYTPTMIVCEKLRAICQQMPEYGPVIRRSRDGASRARDYFDIHMLVDERSIDLTTEPSRMVLRGMFAAKRVPLSLLRRISSAQVRNFHAVSFDSVRATVTSGTRVEPFAFYADFVERLVASLEPLGDE